MQLVLELHDLDAALPNLLGFSKRGAPQAGTFGGLAWLSRRIPWQHPMWPNFYCTKIARAQGMKVKSKQEVRAGFGPISRYEFTLLTLQFTRPQYRILSDDQMVSLYGNANPLPEWQRYTDRFWQVNVSALSRERMLFMYNEGRAQYAPVPGALGQ